MKMTTCSVKFYHIQQYVVAFQEIEEMQIKLAAAIVHTHTQFTAMMSNNLPQKLAFKMYCNLFTGER